MDTIYSQFHIKIARTGRAVSRNARSRQRRAAWLRQSATLANAARSPKAARAHGTLTVAIGKREIRIPVANVVMAPFEDLAAGIEARALEIVMVKRAHAKGRVHVEQGSIASLPRNISLFMVDEKAARPRSSTLSVHVGIAIGIARHDPSLTRSRIWSEVLPYT